MTGLGQAEFAQRQRQLMDAMEPGSIALVPGAVMQRRNRDIDYAFRQDSDLLYLCGFDEPDAVLVLVPERSRGEVIMFCRDRDARAEQWDGGICGPERVAERYGVDDGFPIADLDDILPGLLEGRRRIYLTMGEYPAFDQRLLGYVATIRSREAGGAIPPGEFVSLKHLLHEQRLIKSEAEVAIMREAADISAQAHIRAMQNCRAGTTEAQLEAELIYQFMHRGARHGAYPVLLAAAPMRAYCITPIMIRRCKMVSWLLIDAGCSTSITPLTLPAPFRSPANFHQPSAPFMTLCWRLTKQRLPSVTPVRFSIPHEAAIATMVEG